MVEDTGSPQDYAALRERLTERAATTPTRLELGTAFALSDPPDLALATVGAIAPKVEVQPEELVRFALSIAFAGCTHVAGIVKDPLAAHGRTGQPGWNGSSQTSSPAPPRQRWRRTPGSASAWLRPRSTRPHG